MENAAMPSRCVKATFVNQLSCTATTDMTVEVRKDLLVKDEVTLPHAFWTGRSYKYMHVVIGIIPVAFYSPNRIIITIRNEPRPAQQESLPKDAESDGLGDEDEKEEEETENADFSIISVKACSGHSIHTMASGPTKYDLQAIWNNEVANDGVISVAMCKFVVTVNCNVQVKACTLANRLLARADRTGTILCKLRSPAAQSHESPPKLRMHRDVLVAASARLADLIEAASADPDPNADPNADPTEVRLTLDMSLSAGMLLRELLYTDSLRAETINALSKEDADDVVRFLDAWHVRSALRVLYEVLTGPGILSFTPLLERVVQNASPTLMSRAQHDMIRGRVCAAVKRGLEETDLATVLTLGVELHKRMRAE